MYKTNYFNNINLSSIKTTLSSLENAVASLKNENTTVADTFNSSIEWEGNSKTTLIEGFNRVGDDLVTLRSKIANFISALSSAIKIDEYQDKMESSIEVSDLNSYASSVETNLNEFKTYIDSMSAAVSESLSGFVNSSSVGTDGFGSGIFQVNPEKFLVAKDTFKDWSNVLKTNYDSFLSLKTMVSGDDYLYYAWGVVCALFDNIVKKRDNLENWIENFYENIKNIESSLPEKVSSISNKSTTTYAKTHEYPSKPNFNTYKSSGQTEEIKEEEEEDNSSDYSYSSSGGGSGSYYYPSSSGGSSSGTKKTDTSGLYASTYKGLSDYEKAKNAYYAKKTDTSGSYASTYKGQSDYEKAKYGAASTPTIGNPHGTVIYGNPNSTISSSDSSSDKSSNNKNKKNSGN